MSFTKQSKTSTLVTTRETAKEDSMLKASKAFKKRPVDVILDDEGKVEVKHDGHPLDVNSPGEDVSCHKNPG